jgi:two-component system sensor histidine kinase ArlS
LNERHDSSLKWKIAAWYAALLVFVLVVTSGILVWRFGSIIYSQARDRADAVMNQIVAVANPVGAPLGLQDVASSTPPLQVLLNNANLVYWSSPETTIEIDTPQGFPMVKSANLGGGRIPVASVDPRHPRVFHDEVVRGEPAVVESRLVHVAGASDVVVQVAQSLVSVSRAVDEARRTVLLVLAFAVAAVVLLSVVLASQAINPINELSRAMREIGFERLDRRLAWPRGDEIGRLAQSFDDLLARLEASFSRERQFISDASHELKTPLTSINANATMLLRWAERDERVRRESLETIARESASVGEMVNGMLTLAKADRGDEIPKEPVSLIEEARQAVRYAEPRAKEKGLDLRFEQASDSAIVLADANLIRQMVGNLVDNAIKFTDAGSVDVKAGRAGGVGWVEVSDTGPGIAEGDASRIFERFYRADRSRSRSVPGTGLGLAIVRSIARAHDGNVTVHRNGGRGSRFRVTIPLLGMLAALIAALAHGVASAQTLRTLPSPVVNVVVAGGHLTIRTWARDAVGIHSTYPMTWHRFGADETARRIPSEVSSWAITVPTRHGPAALPAESFVLPPLPAGPHDAIAANGNGDTEVWVPRGTVLLIARVVNGTLTVLDYRGVLVAHVRRGRLQLVRVGGTAYAQVVAGSIFAVQSTFDRIRARTAIGNVIFERCSAGQISATVVRGAVIYDDGTFAEGPAYFSSSDGNVAVGVAQGDVTVAGRSSKNSIAIALPRRDWSRQPDGGVVARVGRGGSFVSALAQGTLAIYRGRLAEHPALMLRLSPPHIPMQDRPLRRRRRR